MKLFYSGFKTGILIWGSLFLCLLLTSCAMFERPIIKMAPVKSYQEKQEEKTYTCLKELMDKMTFNGMKTNLSDITNACKQIYVDDGCK